MIYELVKAYINSNFILLVTFLGLMLLFSGNSAEVIGKKKTALFQVLAVVVFLLSILDFINRNEVFSDPTLKTVLIWADYLSMPIAVGYVAAVIRVMMKNGAYAGVVWERKAVILSAYVVIIAAAYSLLEGQFSVLNPTILISLLFFCSFLHALALKNRSKEYEKTIASQKAALSDQKMQPRFVLDTLSIIKSKTDTDRIAAKGTLSDLIRYLEDTLVTDDTGTLVPFKAELERARTYARIITAGIPGIRVQYHIEDVGFKIPKLALLQLVENCISVGFAGRETGDIVIKSFSSEYGHTVIVQDDGRGVPGKKDNLESIKENLTRLSGGEISVMAEPGFGTTVMISVPNKITDKEN